MSQPNSIFFLLPKLGTIFTTIHQSMTWNEVGDIIYQISTQKELCRMYSSLTTQCSRKLDKRRKKNVDSREQFQLLENQFFSSKSQSCFCVQLTILNKLSSCICKFSTHIREHFDNNSIQCYTSGFRIVTNLRHSDDFLKHLIYCLDST